MTRPSKPSVRRVSAALAPARLAPTITKVCSAVMACPCCQGEELPAGPGVVANESVQRRGHRLGAELLHPAQRHAQMLGLDDDPDALGLELALEPAGHLGRQAVLE